LSPKTLVLDANILIRAVLGMRVRRLLETFSESVDFLVPEAALAEAEEHLEALVAKRGGDPRLALASLGAVIALTTVVPEGIYLPYEIEAKGRLGTRDPDDWPILALALASGSPIWTEDSDFFGCGVATWTTDTVGHYLR
jgi:predicted nucleic acid-binding protein